MFIESRSPSAERVAGLASPTDLPAERQEVPGRPPDATALVHPVRRWHMGQFFEMRKDWKMR